MQAIKKNSDHIPWDPKSSQTEALAHAPVVTGQKAHQVAPVEQPKNKISLRDKRFELSLKTFQMHERMKHERLSRKAILLLETKKFYESVE